jgi:hypothetical protein
MKFLLPSTCHVLSYERFLPPSFIHQENNIACSITYTGGPRYPQSFYLRIHLFKAQFLVKICEFSIRGPKLRGPPVLIK